MKKFIFQITCFVLLMLLGEVSAYSQSLPIPGRTRSDGGGNISQALDRCINWNDYSVQITIFNPHNYTVQITSLSASGNNNPFISSTLTPYEGEVNNIPNNGDAFADILGNEPYNNAFIGPGESRTYTLHFAHHWGTYYQPAVGISGSFSVGLNIGLIRGDSPFEDFVIYRMIGYNLCPLGDRDNVGGIDKDDNEGAANDFGQRQSQEEEIEEVELKVKPNPAVDQIDIDYSIPTDKEVNISIYDSMGKEIKVLTNERKEEGSYTERVSISDLDSGIYYIRVVAGDKQYVEKLVKM